MRPDEAVIRTRQLRRLTNAFANWAAQVRRNHRDQLHDLRVCDHCSNCGQCRQYESDEKSPPRLEPRFVPEHVHSSAATLSRKISLSVTGTTSTDSGLSALTSSMIASAPLLASNVMTRPLRFIRSTPAARNVIFGASLSKTTCTRQYCSRRSSTAPATTVRPRSMMATR